MIVDSSERGVSRGLARKRMSSRWGIFLLMAVIVCLVSSLLIFPRIPTTPYGGDESDWVSGGYYYTQLVENGDFGWQDWVCEKCGPFGKFNLHVGKLLMGIPLQTDPYTRAHPYFAHYDYDASFEANLRAGTAPAPDILARARLAPAFFGVLCCLVIFAIGYWAYNAWVGLIAVSLILSNSLFLLLCSQAMADAFYNFFLVACCLSMVAFFRTAHRKLALWIIAIAGICAGLACSVKITGILLGGALCLFAMIVCVRRRTYTKRRAVSFLALFTLSALATVYLLNPVFWPSWRELQPKAIFDEGRSFVGQVVTTRRIPVNHSEVTQASIRYPHLRNLANVAEFPILFLRWDRSMQRQLSHANWHGNRVLSVNRALFALGAPLQPSETDGVTLNLADLVFAALLAAGLYFVLGRQRSVIFVNGDQAQIVPLLYLLVNYLLIVAFMKLNWNRYYLPTIIAVDVAVAVGVYGLAKLGLEFLAPRLNAGLTRFGIGSARRA